MIRVNRVGGTAISPNGSLVAYVISSPILTPDTSRYLPQIWLASSDGQRNERLTSEDLGALDPAFSPDGTLLAYRKAPFNGTPGQLFCRELTGGETRQITASPNGVTAFRWAPDSRRVAYTMPETGPDGGGASASVIIADESPRRDHLHVVEVNKSQAGIPAARRLTAGSFHITSFDWSPDGAMIVFAHQPTASADDGPESRIDLLSVNTLRIVPLVHGAGANVNPLYSPDGERIVYASNGGEPYWAHTLDLYIVPASGGNARALPQSAGRYATPVGWAHNGRSILFVELEGTSQRLFSLAPDSGRIATITTGPGTLNSPAISTDGTSFAFVHESSESPPEAYVSRLAEYAPRKVSNANGEFAGLRYATTEVIRWQSGDGREIEALLTYPAGYEPGTPCPLIVQIHGGPASAFQQWFTGTPSVYPIQAFAERGYCILCPNPRGSSGYGREFRYANIHDWGGGDIEDVMAGVETLVRDGIADADRLGVCGWSYGGYLGAILAARSTRFRAVSIGGPIVDLSSFAGTTDIPRYVAEYLGGEAWQIPEEYVRRSPIYVAASVNAPTQILHGARDMRVPVSQGWEMYSALKRRGVPTEFIIYPSSPHALDDPRSILDAGNRVLAWFERYLGGPAKSRDRSPRAWSRGR
ncbi:MAG: S9 family peptidase [Bacteroidota bacterium]